ncbi:MAG: phosphoesterase, partial [Betaproteobacteria bacterium]
MSLLAARIGGADWQLFAAPAALHVASRTLVVADAHFGKAAAFRARGVPVPQGTTTANLARLTTAIEAIRPRTLVFLGDLFHARESHAPATLAALAQWRAVHD